MNMINRYIAFLFLVLCGTIEAQNLWRQAEEVSKKENVFGVLVFPGMEYNSDSIPSIAEQVEAKIIKELKKMKMHKKVEVFVLKSRSQRTTYRYYVDGQSIISAGNSEYLAYLPCLRDLDDLQAKGPKIKYYHRREKLPSCNLKH